MSRNCIEMGHSLGMLRVTPTRFLPLLAILYFQESDPRRFDTGQSILWSLCDLFAFKSSYMVSRNVVASVFLSMPLLYPRILNALLMEGLSSALKDNEVEFQTGQFINAFTNFPTVDLLAVKLMVGGAERIKGFPTFELLWTMLPHVSVWEGVREAFTSFISDGLPCASE